MTKIILRNVGDVTVLKVCGKLELGSLDLLTRCVKSAEPFHAGRRSHGPYVLLDLAECKKVDDAAFEQLAMLKRSLAEEKGAIKILHLRTKDTRTLTKICSLFETYDDEPAAVRSF